MILKISFPSHLQAVIIGGGLAQFFHDRQGSCGTMLDHEALTLLMYVPYGGQREAVREFTTRIRAWPECAKSLSKPSEEEKGHIRREYNKARAQEVIELQPEDNRS